MSVKKKKTIKEGYTETISLSDLWRIIGKSMGASDEQVEDLVRSMEAADKEPKEKNRKGKEND